MSFNQIILSGNTGKDPNLRYTPNGAPVCDFSIAVNYKRSGGEDETEWFTVVCWNRLAETVNQYLTKGRRVLVSGRLRSRTWTGDDGKEHFVNEVVADRVVFMERADQSAPSGVMQEQAGKYTQGATESPIEEAEDLPW